MSGRPDEAFYVGYLPTLPPTCAALARRVVAGLLIALPLASAGVAVVQRPVDAGTYEYGIGRDFEGVLRVAPVPHLVSRDAKTGATSAALLVGFAKSGIPEYARRADGKRVAFKGSLIERKDSRMIEVNDEASFRILGEPTSEEARVDAGLVGTVTVRGELLDTKCFFGAMRPAIGKVHRACAIRCLGAGIPPGLRAIDANGRETILLLAGTDGRTLDLDIQLAGRFVVATGTLESRGGIAVLRTSRVEALEE